MAKNYSSEIPSLSGRSRQGKKDTNSPVRKFKAATTLLCMSAIYLMK